MGATDNLPIDPDYTVSEQFDDGMQRSASLGGKAHLRLVRPPRRMFRLAFNGRSTANRGSLVAFYREFEQSYFVLEYPGYLSDSGTPLDRNFPVFFAGPPRIEHVAADCYDMAVDLIEAVGCALESADYPDPADGHPTATIVGTVSGSDQYFIYGGYGLTYTGTGMLALDGASITSPKLDVPLGLHRLYVTGGSGTLEVVI